jgi:hypothetical protein
MSNFSINSDTNPNFPSPLQPAKPSPAPINYFIPFSLLGLLNNFGYVIVSTLFIIIIIIFPVSSAQNLADHFGEKDLMSTFSLCLIVFSAVSIGI